MKIFGEKKEFSIEYKLGKFKEAEMKVYVDNKSICTFSRKGIVHEFKWNLEEIVEWLETNIGYILNEDDFPLPVEGDSAVEIYNNSGNFDSEDDEEFDKWYEKRQEWGFRHSWYSSRSGSYLADVYFRKVGKTIEISWDNCDLYDNIEFINSKGIYYVQIELFKKVITEFIQSFRTDIQKKY